MERLGVFGGTFDPVHVGHIIAAEQARIALQLDRVLFMVTADPWQKSGSVIASASDRLTMVQLALDGIDGLEASDLEIQRGGITYTVDTLEELSTSDAEIFLICGLDVASGLSTWHRADRIAELAELVVVDRPESPEIALGPEWRATRIAMPRIDISSTELRHRINAGEPIDGYVSPAVVHHIRDRRLYTSR